MNEQIKRFYDAMASDEAIRAKAGELNRQFADKKPDDAKVTEAIVAFAADQGFSFTKEELETYSESMKKEAKKTLREDELAAVVGGANTGDNSGLCVRCFVWDRCYCAIGGGGQHHEPDYTCVCIVGGGGGVCSNNYLLVCVGYGFVDRFS